MGRYWRLGLLACTKTTIKEIATVKKITDGKTIIAIYMEDLEIGK